MTRVRPAAEADIPAVVRLFERVFPYHGWTSEADCAAYFREILFGNPWRDAAIQSLVAERGARLAGFYGVVPRPMTLRGRTIRVAVGCNFMVDPEHGDGLVAFELLKAVFGGPQDLTLSDGASAEAAYLWTRLRGRVPLAYNMHWLRPLRPARYLLTVLEERDLAPRALTLGARPVAAGVDALARRLRPNAFLAGELDDEPLEPEAVCADLPDMTHGKALTPAYDAESLTWLLDHAARKPLGMLRARRVLGAGRQPVGWYIYYLCSAGPSELVQLVARPGHYERVLEHVLADAWHRGATAVRGRLDPDGVEALSRRHCWLRWEEPRTLVHARDPEIAVAIEHGDAFLSRLDGEWWMRFVSG